MRRMGRRWIPVQGLLDLNAIVAQVKPKFIGSELCVP